MVSTKERLIERLLRAGRTKLALVGGEGMDTPYAEAFSNVAHAYLQDRAPALLPYEIGFQLLDRNEDGTRAVGVTIFRIGDQNVFAPVFFLRGKLKGHELLYLEGQDLFVPLIDGWVNLLLNRDGRKLGEPADEERKRQLSRPNLYTLSGTQYKIAMLYDPFWHGVFQKWARPLQLSAFLEQELPRLRRALDLRQVVKRASLSQLEGLLSFLRSYPQAAKFLHEKYGSFDFLFDRVRELSRHQKQARSVLNQPDVVTLPGRGYHGRHVDLDYDPWDLQKQAAAVRIVFQMTRTVVSAPGLDEQQQQRLLRDGFVLQDNRPREKTSRLERKSATLQFGPPFTAGTYEVYDNLDGLDGKRALVIPGVNVGGKVMMYVKPVGADKGQLCQSDTVYVRLDEAKLRKEDNLPGGKPASWLTAQHGPDYPRGHVVIVCKQRGVLKAVAYHYHPGSGEYPPSVSKIYTGGGPDHECHDYEIVLRPAGAEFREDHRRGKLYVPRDAKVFLAESRVVTKTASAPERGWHRVKLRDLGDGWFSLNGNRLTKEGTVRELVYRYHLREEDVKQLLHDAQYMPDVKHYVKLAMPLGMPPQALGPGPAGPVPPDQPLQGSMGAAMMGYSGPAAQELQHIEGQFGRTEAINQSRGLLNPEEEQLLQQAIQSGQKEVVEVGALQSMLDKSDPTSIVNEELPSLVRAMNATGKILFALYWHMPAFADRYGKRDLPDLEDWLRNLFELLGKTVLYLREKTIDSMPEAGIADTIPNEDVA